MSINYYAEKWAAYFIADASASLRSNQLLITLQPVNGYTHTHTRVLWDVSVDHTVHCKCMWADFISQRACVFALDWLNYRVWCAFHRKLSVTSSLNPHCPQTHINPPPHTTHPGGAAERALDGWLHQYKARLQWITNSCSLMKPSPPIPPHPPLYWTSLCCCRPHTSRLYETRTTASQITVSANTTLSVVYTAHQTQQFVWFLFIFFVRSINVMCF